ncbi:MAG: hypothetical protein GF411_01130 [Candidatus Lokiarchaeota archaeon]|nr:hypothetical protein [Candidatus Lokiarchaeota archaeon]
MINSAVFNDAQDWMKPYWVKKKQENNSTGKLLSNDTDRNWVLVGSPGGKRFGVMDSKGLVTANPNCGSIDFLIKDDDSIVFPALIEETDIELISSSDQIYQWTKQVGAVQFTRYVYHTKRGDKEAIVNEIHLQNLSMEKLTCSFYIALRPLSVLGVEPISSTHFDEQKGALFGNRELAIIAKTKPTSVIMQSADNPNLPDNIVQTSNSNNSEFSAALGLATAILRYDVTLKSSRSGSFYFISPLDSVTMKDTIPQYTEYSSLRDSTISSWYAFSEKTSFGKFPDSELDEAFSQAKANLAIQARSLLQPENGEFQLPWRECARVLVALNRMGSLGLAKDISLRLSRMIEPSIEEVDTVLAPLVWSILEHYQCTRDDTYLKFLRLFLNKSYPLIIKQTQSDLQEKSQSEKPVVLNEEKIIDMFWRFAALRTGFDCYQGLGDSERFDEVSDLLEKYEILLIDYLHELKISSIKYLVEIVGTSALLSLTDLSVSKMNDILDRIASEVFVKGLVKTDKKNIFSSHLALRVAHYYVVERQNYAVERLLHRALRFLTPYNQFPEFIDNHSLGGSIGDGCSVMASADFILLLREMVAFSVQKTLAILPGVPDSWHESTASMSMGHIPTTVGEVQVEMGVSSNQNQIEIIMKDHLPDELVVYFPTYYTLHMIKIFGGASIERASDESCAFVRLVPLSNNIVLTYRRQ